MTLLVLFQQFDILKILGYGLSGLSLLLMTLSYRLLLNIINLPNPNKNVLGLVKVYLFINLVVVIIVGIFSIPIAGRNTTLIQEKLDLENDNNSIIHDFNKYIQIAEIENKLAAANNSKNESEKKESLEAAQKAAEKYTTLIDSAATKDEKENAEKILTDLNSINAETTPVDQSTKLEATVKSINTEKMVLIKRAEKSIKPINTSIYQKTK